MKEETEKVSLFSRLALILLFIFMITLYACDNSGYLDRISALKNLVTATTLTKPIAVWFEDTDGREHYLKGAITITKASDESAVSDYTIYWGSSATTKLSTTPIATLKKTGEDLSYAVIADTQPPVGATHLLAAATHGTGGEGELISTILQDGKSWAGLSDMSFGAISDKFAIAHSDSKVYLLNYSTKTNYVATINSDGSLSSFTTINGSYTLDSSGSTAIMHNGKIYMSDNIRSVVGTIGTTITWAQGAARDILTCLASDGTTLYSVSGFLNGSGAYSATLDNNGVPSAWPALSGVTSLAAASNCSVSANILAYVSKKGDLTKFQEKGFSVTYDYINSVLVNDALIVLGGYDPVSLGLLTNIFYATLSVAIDDPWKTSTSTMPASREKNLSFANKGYIYVIGGCSIHSVGSCLTPTKTVYYARPSASGNIP